MILLDTNVISEFMRENANERVIGWLNRQPRTSVWTTSITLMEIRVGLLIMPEGKRQLRLIDGFQRLVEQVIERRIVIFDAEAARHAAELTAARQKAGSPGEMRDTMVAGIALAANASVATGNTRHFDGLQIDVINPWNE